MPPPPPPPPCPSYNPLNRPPPLPPLPLPPTAPTRGRARLNPVVLTRRLIARYFRVISVIANIRLDVYLTRVPRDPLGSTAATTVTGGERGEGRGVHRLLLIYCSQSDEHLPQKTITQNSKNRPDVRGLPDVLIALYIENKHVLQ